LSKIEVDKIEQQSGTTVTVGGGACKTAVIDATTVTVGRSGGTVSLAPGASQSGFGTPSSSVLWCTTAKTSPFTAADKVGYFVNTTGGTITVTLPASPSAGDVVAFKDYANTWQTNNVTLANNSSKINGVCGDASLSTEDQSVTLVYVDSTKGWRAVQDSTSSVCGASFITATGGTIVTNGDFKTHIFTGSGTFCVSSGAGPLGVADYLVVAGGGGGGSSSAPAGGMGGGGAGGFRLFTTAPGSNSPLNAPVALTITPGSYPISIGAAGAACGVVTGLPGSNSIFSTITSTGGGGGGSSGTIQPPGGPPADEGNGLPGGSGGGGSYRNAGKNSIGGDGNTPPVSPPQGQPGGQAGGSYAPDYPGSGGGGAGAAGGPGQPGNAGDGGIGSFIADPFIGPTAPSYGTPGPTSSTRYFAGGGGGGGSSGTGGSGGGAAGGGTGSAGTTNTGGGGGGGGFAVGGAGGSGIVMIRYKFQ
jgi:hypothetical protein